MGYYANANGSITAKDATSFNDIQVYIEKNDIPFEAWFDNNQLKVELSDSGNYHDEDVYKFIEDMIPFISAGEISYSGENDDHWKFTFDPNNKVWSEDNGTIIYSLNDISDKELIDELTKRGYTVTKT